MDQPERSEEHEPTQCVEQTRDRSAVNPLLAAVIALAVVLIGALAAFVIKRYRVRSPVSGATTLKATLPEPGDWLRQALSLCHRSQEVLRDLDPAIIIADGSAASRDMRASWTNRASGSARQVSAAASDLVMRASTARGRAAAQNLATSLIGLAQAASDLAGMMDDTARLEHLTSEQKKAEESLRLLQQMV